MDIEGQTLTEIVGRITAVARPTRVIVFGSVATGTATADSDLDLLVLVDGVVDPHRESIRLRAAVGDLGMPIDVVVMSTERFEETKNVIGGIAHPAHKYGRVIYETT